MPPIDLSAIQLDRRPGVLLWRQLADQLRDLIAKQEPGVTLQGEQPMAEELGVDRGVVRQALKALEDEGWVVRRQGLATQVANRSNADELVASLTDVIGREQAKAAADHLRTATPWLLSGRGQNGRRG